MLPRVLCDRNPVERLGVTQVADGARDQKPHELKFVPPRKQLAVAQGPADGQDRAVNNGNAKPSAATPTLWVRVLFAALGNTNLELVLVNKDVVQTHPRPL